MNIYTCIYVYAHVYIQTCTCINTNKNFELIHFLLLKKTKQTPKPEVSCTGLAK